MIVGASLGSQETLIVVVGLLTLTFTVWAFVDILKRPGWAWERAGKNRFVWLIVMIIFTLVFNLAFFVSLWYLLFVRPKVRNQQELGRGVGMAR